MRNYKSLDAYKYFADGWILETQWKTYDNIFLLIGKVKHSYSINQAPLKPWVAIKKNGSVECGHCTCTCMAGLGETCSHISAILYWLETAVRIHNETTCTSKSNSWLPPSMPTACQEVPYVTMEELEQVAPQRKKAKINPGKIKEVGAKNSPSQQELDDLYKDLSKVTDRKPAILSLIPPYCEQFTQSSDHLPVSLQSLYEPENLQLNYLQLIEKAEHMCREPITGIQVRHLENLTRGQASNKHWFRYRAGRITASLIHQVY